MFLKDVGQAPVWKKELLDGIAAALIQQDRLKHPKEEVRLLVSCCLADIIRIYAPDAPYDEEALKVSAHNHTESMESVYCRLKFIWLCIGNLCAVLTATGWP